MQKKRFSPRYKRMVPLASLLPKITKPALSKVGIAYGKIALNWDDIVGGEWALKLRPIKLSRTGILHVAVRPAHTLQAQYNSQMLLSRLNKYLGKNSVQGLHYIQQNLPFSEKKSVPEAKETPLPPKQTIDTTSSNDELSAALERLKTALNA